MCELRAARDLVRRKGIPDGRCDGLRLGMGQCNQRRPGAAEYHPQGVCGVAGGHGGFHSRHQCGTKGLMQAVVHGSGEEIVAFHLQGRYKKRGSTAIENRVGPADLLRKHGARLGGRQFEVRDGHNQVQIRRKFKGQEGMAAVDRVGEGQTAH